MKVGCLVNNCIDLDKRCANDKRFAHPTLATFAICITLAFLNGCASVKVTPPTEHNIDRSQMYSLNFDKTWNRAVDWFAEHNITIDKIEKPSGFLGKPIIKRYLAINITVRESDANNTKVNVNSFGEFQLSGQDAWDGHLITSDGRCLPTGEIESSILKFIGTN